VSRIARIVEGLFASLAALLSVSSLLLASDPTTFGLTVFGLAVATIAALCCLVLIAWRRRKLAVVFLPAILFVATVVLIECDVPLQARFAWSRAALEGAAQSGFRMESRGEAHWRRIGLFRIFAVNTDAQGLTHFELGACGFLERCEIVYDPKRTIRPRPPRGRALHGDWWIFERS
jgi:hypothetical protein